MPQALFWQTLLETGARCGEAKRARWSDLDEAALALTLRAETTKSKRTRLIPLRPELVERLLALRELHAAIRGREVAPGDPIFLSPRGKHWPADTVSMQRIFRRLLERAGIARSDGKRNKLDIHALRHTAATRFARLGVPLVQTQHILGHADPKMTARVYTHLGVEDLRSAVDLLPPLAPAPAKPRLVTRQDAGEGRERDERRARA